MGLLGWAQIQHDQCSHKKSKSEQTSTAKDHAMTQGEDSHLQVKERALRRS